MHHLLTLGGTLHTASGHACTVETSLGGGGQGEVYRVRLDGQTYALKWYFPEQATPAQRQALVELIDKGAPSAAFLWPFELMDAKDRPGFGYLMPLRDARFKGIVDLMKRRVDPTFRALSMSGLQLAQAFLQLHARGLCYRDISFGNVFFDPTTGEIQVCDNDNVAIDGGGTCGILGTPRFIAPEIVRGEAVPSTQTDLFSLAVLLFYLFHVHHPLEGSREAAIKCLDVPAMNRLYGTEPRFIFDPSDDSNRPVPGLQDNPLAHWPIYPQLLRDRFTHAFTVGLHQPHERVRESDWSVALARLADAIWYCGHCDAENFHDAEAPPSADPRPEPCWSCGRPLLPQFRLRLGRQMVMLNRDTQLYPHHLDPARRYDYSQPLAAVQQHPQDPTRWGLQNLTADKWVMTRPDGQLRDVEPGRSAALAPGVRLHLGKVEGEIEF